MKKTSALQSVVTRLILCLIAGGALVSCVLTVLELNRAEAVLRSDLTRRFTFLTRNLQSLGRRTIDQPEDAASREALSLMVAGEPLTAVRLRGPDLEQIVQGDWPAAPETTSRVWPLGEAAVPIGDEVELNRPTLVQAPFLHHGQTYHLELLVDGPLARQRMLRGMFNRLAMQWLLLAVVVLLGLLLVRRWVVAPLNDTLELVRLSTGAEAFRRLANQSSGEFRELSGAIGEMVERIDRTSSELARRERAFQSLYQFAPTAMLSLAPDGRVVEANRRAAQLLGVEDESLLLGASRDEFVCASDLPKLQQTIDRLAEDERAHCDLGLRAGDQIIEARIEAIAVSDQDGAMQSVRLSLIDVTPQKQRQRELAEKSNLMNLLFDHMSDAIVFIDPFGRVATCNERMCELLHTHSEALVGSRYSPSEFWAPLGVIDRSLFLTRMKQIESNTQRAVAERFDAEMGNFLFQGIPVQDASGAAAGRLWVVHALAGASRAATDQPKASGGRQTLLGVRGMARLIAAASDTTDLRTTLATALRRQLQADLVAVSIPAAGDPRSGRCEVDSESALPAGHRDALSEETLARLLPRLQHATDPVLWAELPQNEPWTRAFEATGVSTLAAVPVRLAGDSRGLIWVARTLGDPFAPDDLHLLELVARLVSARLVCDAASAIMPDPAAVA